MSEKQRIEFIDLAKGFCILLVVFAHITTIQNGYSRTHIDNVCSLFRMPLYFFLSGLFFKTYGSFGGFALRKTNKLLIPFCFWYLLTAVLLPSISKALGLHLFIEDAGWSSLLAFIIDEEFSNSPIWFLWCLFILNIIFYCIFDICKNLGKYIMAAIIIISLGVGISGCMLGKNSINLPAFIDSAFTALPFFVCGYIFKKNTNILYPNKYDKYNWIFVLLCFSYIYYFGSRITYMKNDFHGTSIWIAYSGGIIGTLFIIFLSKIIKTLPLIRYYGRYSIIILVTHYQVCKIVKMAIQSFNFGTYLSIASIFVITMFLELLVIPLCIKFLPWFTAQKDAVSIENGTLSFFKH